MNVGVTEGTAWTDEEYVEGVRLGKDSVCGKGLAAVHHVKQHRCGMLSSLLMKWRRLTRKCGKGMEAGPKDQLPPS